MATVEAAEGLSSFSSGRNDGTSSVEMPNSRETLLPKPVDRFSAVSGNVKGDKDAGRFGSSHRVFLDVHDRNIRHAVLPPEIIPKANIFVERPPVFRPLNYEPDANDLWIRGETAGLVAWARQEQENCEGDPSTYYGTNPRPGIKFDNSVDELWERDNSCIMAFTDVYCQFCCWLHIGVKILIYVLPLLILQLPSILILNAYMRTIPMCTEYLNRNSRVLSCIFLTAGLLFIPVFIVMFVSFLHDVLMYYICNLVYLIFFKWLLFCQWCDFCRQYRRSMRAIAPFRGGPWIYWSDFCVAAIGHINRIGWWGFNCRLALGTTMLPTAKYFCNANPYLYDLSIRFMQQISTSMQDMEPAHIESAFQRICCRLMQEPKLKKHEKKWQFLPHYPYPTSSGRDTTYPRSWHLGIQVNDFLCLFVHTTHSLTLDFDKENHQLDLPQHMRYYQGHPEDVHPPVVFDDRFFVLSNSAHSPIVRVVLWYNNPYHLLTGFVEAQLTTGGGFQQEKFLGGEHPMWCVSSKSPLISKHISGSWFKYNCGSGEIDAFFDRWLPKLVHEMRRITRGKEAAEALHEEVVSLEGFSPGLEHKAVPHFSQLKKLSEGEIRKLEEEEGVFQPSKLTAKRILKDRKLDWRNTTGVAANRFESPTDEEEEEYDKKQKEKAERRSNSTPSSASDTTSQTVLTILSDQEIPNYGTVNTSTVRTGESSDGKGKVALGASTNTGAETIATTETGANTTALSETGETHETAESHGSSSQIKPELRDSQSRGSERGSQKRDQKGTGRRKKSGKVVAPDA